MEKKFEATYIFVPAKCCDGRSCICPALQSDVVALRSGYVATRILVRQVNRNCRGICGKFMQTRERRMTERKFMIIRVDADEKGGKLAELGERIHTCHTYPSLILECPIREPWICGSTRQLSAIVLRRNPQRENTRRQIGFSTLAAGSHIALSYGLAIHEPNNFGRRIRSPGFAANGSGTTSC